MTYESTFGQLESGGGAPSRPTAELPFRVAILGDFSGRAGREPAGDAEALLARHPIKISYSTLDEAIESVAPRLEFTVGDGQVAVALEFSELDDFQPDAVHRQVDRFSDLSDDDDATALMREILHHPQYQALESAWRGVDWLLRRTSKSDFVQVVLLDMTAEEFAADLTAGDDLKSTALYRQLIEQTAESPDGQPWGLLAALYTFEPTVAHAEVLGRTARIAARAGAPLLAAVSAEVLAEEFKMAADVKAAWEALGALGESAYVGLAVPRFLLRPPFGEDYRPAEAFRFEEFSGTADSYLWGNPGLACAGLLCLGFMKSGWGFKPGQNLGLDSMPMHTHRDADGESVAVSSEVRFTSTTSQALVQLGFMPLLAVRGRDSIELACIRPLALETGSLAGRWEEGAGIAAAKSSRAPVGSGVGVGMSGKQTTAGSGSARGSTARKPDPEVDDDLAAMLGGGNEPPADEPAAEPPAEESAAEPSSAEPAAEGGDSASAELDPELAALLGGGDPPAAEEPATDSNAEGGMDPELAALLGEAPATSEEPPPADAGMSDMDPELAALLGETPSPSEEPPAAEADAETSDMDPELAALLGETPAPSEEPAAAEADTGTSDMDPELAALLGEAPPPAEEPPVAEAEAATSDMDAELAALLGESAAPTESSENLDSSHSDESASIIPEPEETGTAMATIVEDHPQMDEEESIPTPGARPFSMEELESQIQTLQQASNFGSSGSPPVLDFKSLLAPIPGDEPAGGSVPYDVKEQLEQARKDINPELYAADDPTRPTDVVKADWSGIIELCEDVLRNTSKNLLIAARLLEALAKKHGFGGLRDGLHLMRLMVETCWDRLEPPVEDDDLEVRAAPFHWIDDPDRGAIFPNSIKSLPIITAGGSSLSWQSWQQAGVGQEAGERAIASASRELCQAAVDNIAQAVAEIKHLQRHLSTKMAGDAPGFSALRPAMEESLKLAQQILQRKGESAASGEPSDGAAPSGNGQGQGEPRLSSRDDVYRQLAIAAAALERLEPHSPVPFLVRRAVEFGALPFPQLMQALIRDANVLSEMNRELGIKPPQSESQNM